MKENEDPHLGTGEYEPKRYWEERAKTSKSDVYEAVCVYGISEVENSAMEQIQLVTLKSVLHAVKLEGSKVMEFGCGVGRWASFFLERGASYTGVDISESMLEMARARAPLATLHQIDSARLPFADNELDIVFSITVLHHNSIKNQQAIIDEMVRVTKPGGLILLMEGIEEKLGHTSFNMFPRSIDEWVTEVEKDGRTRLVKNKLARWWLLRDATFKLLRSLGVSKANKESMKKLNMILVWGGTHVDKYLNRLLPRRYATNTAMLFKKVEIGESVQNT